MRREERKKTSGLAILLSSRFVIKVIMVLVVTIMVLCHIKIYSTHFCTKENLI